MFVHRSVNVWVVVKIRVLVPIPIHPIPNVCRKARMSRNCTIACPTDLYHPYSPYSPYSLRTLMLGTHDRNSKPYYVAYIYIHTYIHTYMWPNTGVQFPVLGFVWWYVAIPQPQSTF